MNQSVTVRVIVSICLIFCIISVLPGTVEAQAKKRLPFRPVKLEKKPQQEPMPGFQPLTKMSLKKVEFNKSIKPVEVVKGDHVANGVALRNRGGGVINLRGVPAGKNIHKAYLYWDILGNSAPRCMTVSINGVEVQGKLIGTGSGPCWGVKHNFAYRANVPACLLYVGGNGDYKISGVPSGQGYGMSPWKNHKGPYLAEGATLVVFFTSKSGYDPETYLYEAPISGYKFSSGFSTNLLGFNAPNAKAKFTMIGADGQTGNGVTSFYNCTSETSFFQGKQIAGPPVSPPGSGYHDADSDWNGNDGGPLNQLWDTRTHMVPIKKGSRSAVVKYQSHGDCLVIVAFFLTM